MRVLHSAWSWLNDKVAADSVAGNTFTGIVTRLTFRYPFQVVLAAMAPLSVVSRHTRSPAHPRDASPPDRLGALGSSRLKPKAQSPQPTSFRQHPFRNGC